MVATTLRRGQAAVVGYNTGQTDGNGTTIDSLEFAILAPIGSGTIIRFTDRAWNGSAFVNGAGDGSFAFTAATDLAAGTVITITFSGGNANITVNGVTTSVSAGGFDLEQAGDAIYVYQGTDANTPTTFLSAIEIGDGNNTFGGSLANTGLVNGVTAVSTALDSATYHGPTTEAYAHFYNNEQLLENIMDSTNWVGDDADGQKALDQPSHNGPYNVSPNLGLWIAGQGGGQALVHVGADPTVSSGQFGYNLTQLYTNNPTLLGARDIAFDTVEGKFFVAEGERILQGNISDLLGNPSTQVAMTVLYTGTKPDGMVTQFGDNNIFNLEVDTVNNIIYFSHGSQLSKIGYNTAGQTATVLADFNVGNPVAGSNRNHIDDFVIHFASGNVYATSHRITSGQDGDQLTKNYMYRITGLDAGDGTNAFTFANGAITFLPFAPDDDDATNGFTWVPGEGFPQEEGTLEGVAISADGNTLYFTAATTLYDHDGDGGFSGPGGFGTPPQLRMGGVFSYALTGNPTGTYTQIWQQLDDGDTVSQAISHTFGPQGLLDDIEIDPVTGHLYFLDQTGDQLGAVNPAGDEGIWRIATNGTGLTYFANINNINAMGPSSIWLNHAPTVSSSTQATPGVTEASSAPSSGNTALVQPFTALDVTDHETAGNPNQQLAGATVWVSNNFQSGSTHQDTLTINGAQSGSLVFGATSIAFSYNAATGAMTLTGISTFNNYEATIALVRFNTSGDDVTAFGAATNRTISWAVSDGLNHSDPVSTTISVTGINDAPVNTPGAAMNFSEDTTGTTTGTPPVNAVTGISVFDVDADPATQDITVTLSVAVGTLTIRTDVTGGLAAGEVTGNGTATLVLTGTQNQINATLAAVNGSAQANGLVFTPPANFNGATNLTITTNDSGFNGNDPGNSGTGTTEQDQDVKIINVADVNDAPTVGGDGTEDSPVILEDVPYTNLNAPSIATLFGGQFADLIDIQQNGGNPTGSTGDTFAGIAIVANGSDANGNWQWWDGDSWENIGTATVDAAKTFTAATLIRFSPTLHFNGAAPTLTAHLIESGGPAITNGGTVDLNPAPPTTGPGSVYTTGTVTLSQAITPVNDAPVNTIPGTTLTLNEDATNVALTGLSVADVEAGPASQPLTVTFSVGRGTLTISTAVGGGINATHVTGGAGGASNQASITITATQAQINATLANATGLTYTPTSNVNGNDTLTMVTSDLGYVGIGGILTDTDMRTLGVTAINDAPTVGDGTESATAINEDTPNTSVNAQTVAQLFGPQFSDATDQVAGGSSANTMLGIAIVANGSNANGTWEWLNGAVWTAIGAASTAAAKTFTSATQLRFNPTTDFNGPAPTLTAHLVDNSTGTITNGSTVNISAGGSTGGTTRYSAGTIVLSQDVTAVNDGPLNTVPGTQTINEDATLTFSTGLGTAISVADADAAPGLLTVTLSMLNGQLTLSTLAGLSFGAGDGTDDTTMTFTGTAVDINAALNGLLYETTLDYNGSDTLTITTNDNGNTGPPGALQDTDTVTINITAVADIVNDTLSFNEDSGTQSLTMPNNDTFENPGRSITAVTQGLHGFVAINDNNTSGDTTDDYVVYTQAADYNGTDSFTYTVTSGGVTETATVNVGIAAVADIADDTATVGEDSGTTTIDVIANDSFENGGFSITGVTQGLHGIVTIIDGPDLDLNPDYVTYTPAADYNGSDSFTYTVTSGGVTETATVNVTITAVADAVDDVVAVAQDSVGNVLNLLGNDNFESAARAITSVGPALNGTTSINDNGTPLNTADDYVTYTPTGGHTGPDSFTYTVTSGGVTETANVAVTVASPQEAPVIDLNGTVPAGIDNTADYIENASPTLLATGAIVSDVDDTNIESATVQVTTGFITNFDYLTVNGATGPDVLMGISFNYSAATGILTLTGSAPLADYQAVLRQVGFESTSDTPGTSRTISWTINDGSANSTTAFTTVTVTPVNDAPAGADNTITRTEDAGAYTFTAADFPFSDVDLNAFAGIVITSLPTPGILLYDSDGPGGGPAVLAMAGQFVTAAQLANGNLIYSPAGNGNGSPYSSFTFQVRDNGGTAGTGQDTDQLANTLTFNISAVNDAPVVDLNGAGGGISTSVNYTEDGAAVAIGSGVTVTDPDSGNGDMIDSATIVLTDRVAGDSLTVTGALPPGIVAVTTPTAGAITIQITGAGTGAQYQALIESIQYSTTSQDPTVGGTDLARTITVTVNDGEVDSAVATTTVNITALDDPAAALPDAFTITEAGSIVGGNVFANNGSGPDNDPDGPPLSVSAVSGGTVGVQFTLPSGALLTMNANGTFNYNPNNAFDTTPTAGSGASNTPAPDSFTYTLTGGGSAMVSLTITGLDTNDFLFGTGGTDSLTGGIGNDFYFVDQAADTANETAGQGFDVVWTTVSYVLAAGTDIEALSTRFWEGTGAINLTGNEIANNIYGNAGANALDGGGGNDVLFGFGGNDSLTGGTGTDVMHGSTGDDFYFIDNSGDSAIEAASEGYDVAWTTASYVLAAGIEIEVLSARFWEDTTAIDLAGNALDNVLVGNNGVNNLSGMGGNDILNGMGGNDILLGGAGNDRLLGGTGADAMFGGANDDFYFVDNSGDTATESASQGFDVVWTSVSYALAAGSEIEALSAISWEATDALTLVGNDLGNALYGNAGANILNGRGGNDTLVGFGGTDSFLFDSALGAGNVDTIADFSGPSDTIVLDDSVFAALTPGTLNANAFVIGTAALDADDRIIYDSATGALYYDADGNGAGLAVQFAILQGAPPINSSDFQVI